MANENVGGIYYTVSADTAPLVNGGKKVNDVLDSMDKRFNSTDKAASKTELQLTKTASATRQLTKEIEAAQNPLGNLTKLMAGFVTIQGAMGLINMAESYGEMAERIRMATSSAEEYEHVQQRLLATANGTYRSMKEAQEMYILTADTLRSMGYTTDQAMDIVDSLSYAFVKNATSNDRANSAISAFTNSMMKGKVEADAWSSIIAATPSIINDLAEATGKTSSEIRELGASGKITSQQLSEGLRKSLDENKAAADGMATTVKDAFTALRNNLSMYIGEANMANGATALLSKSVLLFGENIETVVSLLGVLGAGAMAKYIAQVGASIVASGRAALAARAEAAAELEKARALAASTAAAAANATAMQHLGGSNAAATAAVNAHTAAQQRLAAAKSAANAAGVGLISVLGGPAGIIALVASAAAGIYLFGSNSSKAAVDVDKLTDSIDKLTKSQLENRRMQAQDAVESLKKSAREASTAVDGVRKDYEALVEAKKRGARISEEELANAKRAIVEQEAEADARIKTLQAAIDAEMKLGKAIEDTQKKSSGEFIAKVTADPEAAKRIKSMQDEIALLQVAGEERAKLRAIQALGDKATDAQKKEAEELAATIYKLTEAEKARQQATKDSASESKKSAEDLKKQREKEEQGYIQAGEALQDLALKIQLASLDGKELAVTQAVLAAGEYATPEQIAAIQELSAKLYDVEQRKAKLDEIMRAGGVDKWVTGDVDPLTGGVMDDQQARFDAEAAREQERYAAQLDRLRQAMEAEAYTYEEYYARFEDMARVHAERMDQIKQASMQVQLSAIESGFGDAASAMKAAFGEQNALYKAAFVAQKAAAIAQSAIAIQQGIAMAAAQPWPLNLAAMASVAAATASIIGNISSISMGGRQYGGPVAANGLYRINENGAPEIFNAANGQQYMLPNTRGEVVSNKDATSGSGYSQAPKITVQLIEDKSRGGQVEQSTMDGETFIRAFVADIRSGGDAAQALEGTYGVSRVGT